MVRSRQTYGRAFAIVDLLDTSCKPDLRVAWEFQHSPDVAGVILLSEELHRVAYNAAFENFDVRPNGKDEVANW